MKYKDYSDIHKKYKDYLHVYQGNKNSEKYKKIVDVSKIQLEYLKSLKNIRRIK